MDSMKIPKFSTSVYVDVESSGKHSIPRTNLTTPFLSVKSTAHSKKPDSS